MYHFYNCHQIWLCSALSKYTFLESTKQRSLLYPPPHPSPSCTSPVTDIWWVETLLLSISERIHFYKKNNNLTDTICMIDGTTRWGGVIDTVNHVSEEGFPNRTTAAYITCMTHLFLLGWKGSRLTQARILEPWCVLSSVH